MSKPKKWIEATTIEQITAGARVRFTHYESAPVEFTALAVNIGVVWAPTEHSFNFDREGRTWYVRNPEWTKPKKIDGLHEGRTAKHWHDRFRTQVKHTEVIQSALTRCRVKIEELEAKIAELEVELILTDFDDIKVGDRVRRVDDLGDEYEFAVADTFDYIASREGRIAMTIHTPGEWFLLHRPEPVMPEEPPIGSFFRVNRTGHSYFKDGDPALQYIQLNTADSAPQNWDSIVQPGDTLTMLELTPVGEGE